MKSVAIIGPGALGLALAGVLSRQGASVLLVTRDGAQRGPEKKVLEFELGGRVSGEFRLPTLRFGEFLEEQRSRSLTAPSEIWVTVRAWQWGALDRQLPEDLRARVWLGCNGLEVSEGRALAGRFLAWFGSKRLDRDHPCFEISDGGGVEWAPREEGKSTFQGALVSLAEFFSGSRRSRFESIAQVEWRKAIWNSALNPLAALSGGLNGRVVREAEWRTRFECLVLEGLQVARASLGEALWRDCFGDEARFLESLVRATEGTAENRNSLRVDLERGRSTEVPWLLERLRERARTHGVAVPELDRVSRELLAFGR